jgi:lauroyl/myristoyl acyltransferase
MAAKMYSEDDIREMLRRAYPQKSEDEIEDMVEETMEQYLEEMKQKKEEGE